MWYPSIFIAKASDKTLFIRIPFFFFPFLIPAKPIDLLAQYVSSDDNDLEIQMHEPYTILVVSTVCFQYVIVLLGFLQLILSLWQMLLWWAVKPVQLWM